ncbi:MAG: hypothetical protein LQ342_003066 [Letrouitia transgressa]|nr:MAG: hypothetical protein LQ342_003066 [Letrouitia transgressa]
MFAVPGWSVSADALTTQKQSASKQSKSDSPPERGNVNHKKSKISKRKRKRNHGTSNEIVPEHNLDDLWAEYKRKGLPPLKAFNCALKQILKERRRRYRKVKRKDQAKLEAEAAQKRSDEAQSQAAASSVAPLKDITQSNHFEQIPQFNNIVLTPLQQSMKSKLVSARFRHLNQTLYTIPSQQASKLFSSTPGAYSSYHAGFRAQVAVWPQNPVEQFIEDVKQRGNVETKTQSQLWRQEKRKGGQRKAKGAQTDQGDEENIMERTELKIDPLPRTQGCCGIVDLGCGDAMLHKSLLPFARSLDLKFHSVDLSQGDGPNSSLIDVDDMASLPLPDGIADVAIFCLSLMGTNWISFIEEANRVLRWGGECWVAEIKSRFGRLRRKSLAETSRRPGGNRGKAEDVNDEELNAGKVEEEGRDGGEKEETDVGAFIDVMRKRGFQLKGEVDFSNKMFVRMRYVKNVVPVKGKGVPKVGERGFDQKTRFLDNAKDEVDSETEATVLKPCVYKTR